MSFFLWPPIVRSRGFYVYSHHRIRYLDLYQQNGRMSLGHRLNHRGQLIKGTLDKGLYHSYPHTWHIHLKKAFCDFFGSQIRIWGFRDKTDSQIFLERKVGISQAPERWSSVAQQWGVARWRLGQDTEDQDIKLWQFEPLVPCFLGFIHFWIEKIETTEVSLELVGSPWDLLSVRLVEQSLRALMRTGCYVRGSFSLGEQTLWRRYGNNLIPLYVREHHILIADIFKKQKILLPPSFEEPAVLPWNLSPAEEKPIRRSIQATLEKLKELT